MLKYYIINGKEYQYEEGQQPIGAIELGAGRKEEVVKKPPSKAVTPKNKARKGRTKWA